MKLDARAEEGGSPLAGYVHGRVPRRFRLDQILTIAEDRFGEFGYQQTSMDDIAKRAGVSKPVVYDLVGSKEELFRMCMARSADELAERVATAVLVADEPDCLRAGSLAFFLFVDDHRRAWRSLLSNGTAPVTTEMAEARRHQANLVAQLLFTDGQAGPVDPVAADALANTINGAFEALAGWWHDHLDVTAEELADFVVRLFEPGLQLMIDGELGTAWSDGREVVSDREQHQKKEDR
jgi:AcrR family transcriptional regulator